MADEGHQGPLKGLTVVEMAGLGPAPLACLMLAEMGARVLRIERISSSAPFLAIPPAYNLDRHGRKILKVDLKQARGSELVLSLVEKADVLVEGFRPGVMERLGLGPSICTDRNSRLVYARMTGFGQDGPMADRAGHDITYLAYTGALHAIGEKGRKPVPPLNLAADYGGGTMFLLTGILAALVERGISGRGQVVDAAMVDGVSMLSAPFYSFQAAGMWREKRGSNLLDTGAPFYDTYETADGGHMAVGCLEPQFFAEFCRLLPLDRDLAARQYDPAAWSAMRERIERRFKEKTRDEWAALFEPTDACVAPVLTFSEAARHPHGMGRKMHVREAGFTRPAPAPRLSRTPGRTADLPDIGLHEILEEFGLPVSEIDALARDGIVAA